jgi:plasmid stabilization system protein ParE
MGSVYRVIVLPQAFDDLDEILDHIKQDSRQNAAATIDQLWQGCQSLNTLPHRYKVHRTAKDANRIIRSMPVPPFIVYYRIIEASATIRVLTIRHGARRAPRRFRR